MASAFQRQEILVEDVNVESNVPNDPKAKLMYYLSCITTLLELDENDMPMELTNYENYRNLDNAKTRSLIDFCELLSPDNLEGRCIFQTDDLDGASNREMELSMAQSTMDLTTSSITIAGRNAQITTVMLYTRSWRRNNYDEPMAELARARNNSSCILSSCILL